MEGGDGLFQRMFEDAPFGIALVGADRRLLRVSPAFARLLGTPAEVLVGRLVDDVTWPEDRELTRQVSLRSREAGARGETLVKRYRHADGTAIWAEVTVLDPRVAEGPFAGGRLVIVHGLAQQRQADAQRRQTEQRLRMALEAGRMGTWEFELSTGAFVLGDGTAALLGLDAGKPHDAAEFFGCVHVDDLPAIQARLEEALTAEGRRYELEYRIHGPDGGLLWQAVQAEVLRDAAGTPLRLLGVVQDVTTRRHAEEARREANERLTLFFDATSDLIALLGRREIGWEVLSANRAFWDWTHLTPDAIAGRDVLGAMPATSAAELGRLLSEACEARRRIRWVGPVTMAGATRELEIDVHPIVDPDGVCRRLMTSSRDVDDLRRALRELEHSHERFRLLGRATDDLVYDWDISTGEIRWNEVMRTRFGYELDARSGNIAFWDAKLHPDDRARVGREVEQAIASPEGHLVCEYRFARADGAWLHVFDRGVVERDDAGRALRMIGAMADVTPQRELEARLRISDRMASVGTLAAGVAHEINNPLAFALLSLKLARNELHKLVRAEGSLLPPTTDHPRLGSLVRAIDDATTGCTRVKEIVRDLKTFSRPEEERVGPVVLERVIESALSMARAELRPRARLVRDYQDVPPVSGNESRLSQLFLNLIVNAAQAIDEGDVEGNEVRLVLFAREGEVIAEIQDSGPGIPRELRPRIFDPFFTTKPLGVGTGLGLTICHGIVAAHRGSIEIDDRPGGGTILRVRLPALIGAVAAASRPVLPPAPSVGVARERRILVVDDEPLIGDSIEELLDEHDVEAVRSGREALERLFAGEPFEVVVCDLMMPELTGMDVHEALLQRAPALAARMIFMTGGAFTPRASAFLDAVGNPRLAKPFSASELRAAIAAVVASVG